MANKTTPAIQNLRGYIGIGTTSPSSKLHVYGGDFRLDNGGGDGFIKDASNNSRFYFGTGTYVNSNTGGPVAFQVAGGEKMRVNFDGNVGIGTTSPGTYDAAKIGSSHRFFNVQAPTGNYAVNTLAGGLSGNGDRIGFIPFVNDTNSASYKYSAWIGSEVEGATANQKGGRLVFSTTSDGSAAGPIERMRITSAGNVGIGTASPVGMLSVVNPQSNNNTWTPANNPDLWVSNAGTSNSYYAFGITTNSGDILSVTNAGNVGIGTTSPSAKLHVDSGLAHNTVKITTGSSGGTGYDAALYINGGANNSEMSINMGIVGNEDRDRIKTYQGNMYFRTNDSENMIINSSGNVGIGTTSPNEKLTIVGDATKAKLELLVTGNTGESQIHFGDDDDVNSGRIAYNHASDYMSFYTNNVGDRMIINSSGNVGIGTTSPSAKLDIYGDSNSSDNMIELINSKYDSTNTTGETGILFGWNNHVAARITAFKEGTVNRTGFKIVGEAGFNVPTTIATFRSTGRVGIGTTDPVEILHIGSGTVPAATLDGVLLTLGSGQYYQASDGTKNIFMGVDSSSYGIVGMLTNHALGFRTNNTEHMRITTGGNVGIGTTAPAYKLDVSGTGRFTGNLHTESRIGIGTSTPTESLSVFGKLLITTNQGALDNGYFTKITSGYNANPFILESRLGVLMQAEDYGNSLSLHSGNAERVRINGANGNVGIGTTSPAQLLHISNTSGDFGAEAVLRGSTSTGTPKSEVAFKRGTSGDGAKMVLRTSDSSGTIQDVMTLDTSGNVGIGTSFPEAKLFIQYPDATTNTVLRTKLDAAYSMGISNDWVSTYVSKLRLGRVGSSTATSNMEFVYDIQGTEYGSIKRNYTASSLKFERGTTVDMIINGSGNVGIGTTGPTEKLTIFGTAASPSTSGIGANGNFAIESSNGNSLYFGSYAASPYGCWLQASNYIDQSLKYPIILNPNGGNVGIGTTSPNRKLTVNAPGAANGTQNITAQFSNATVGATSSAIYIGAYTGTDWLIGKNIYGTAGHTNFEIGNQSTGSSPVVSINNNNNVGIGTTSPGAKLHVVSTSTTEPTARIQSNGYTFLAGGTNDPYHALILRGIPAAATTYEVTIGDQMSFLEYGGDFRFYEKNPANSGTLNEISRIHKTDSFFISNVGIGTTSPASKLDVDGDIALKGTAVFNFVSPALTIGDIAGTDSVNSLKLTTADDSTTVYLDDGGNVGIGTTSPEGKLDVNGAIIAGADGGTAGTLALTDRYAGDDHLASIGFLRSSGGTYIGYGVKQEGSSDWTSTFDNFSGKRNYLAIDEDSIKIAYAAAQQTTVGDAVTLSEKFRFNLANGRLGIGTTAPATKLHAVGTTGEVIRVSSAETTTGAVDTGAYVSLGGHDGVNPRTFGYLGGFKENGTSGNYSGYLSLATRANGGTSTEKMRITSSGNVGIGTSNPGSSFKLDVNGYIKANSRIYVRDSTKTLEFGTDYIQSYVTSGTAVNPIRFFTGATEKARIDGNGNVGIGTTSPNYKLDVNGDIAVKGTSVFNLNSAALTIGDIAGTDSVTNLTLTTAGGSTEVFLDDSGNVGINDTTPSYALDVTGTIRATGDVIAYSDARVKENVETIPNALDKVKAMRGVGYNKIGEEKRSIGVIAQEMLDVIPEVVHTDDQGMHSVAYGNLVGVLIEAMKEQQQQIDELKAKIDGITK